MSAAVPEIHDLADGAAVAEYRDAPEADANRAAVSLGEALLAARLPGLRDAIPGARTLFLEFDPRVLPHEALRREIRARSAGAAPARQPRRHEIPTLYGVATGADLADLAERAGISPEELCRRHAEGQYTVAFLGFAPGWAYLSGLDPALHAPRLATPRPRVPAGSVAIGGPYTGVYPSATPGGWRLVGRAAVRLFDEESDPPALLAPGDAVWFAPIAPQSFAALEAEIAAATSRVPTSPGGRPAFRVVKSGVFASVQGGPRSGGGGSGLPPGGAMDEAALTPGNALLGNPPDAAAVEMTLLGPELEALSSFFVCVSGAAMPLERNGASASAAAPLRVEAGDRLRFGPSRDAMRAYLCVEGGLRAPGRLALTKRLEPGEILMIPSGARSGARVSRAAVEPDSGRPSPATGAEVALRVMLDPRRDRFFERRAIETFLSQSYRVSSTSDRRGIRLEGPALAAAGSSEMPPEGTARGTIQVPLDGQPILLGPDRPITGGYARIGVVVSADWRLAAQAPPGRAVRFVAATLAEALAARAGIQFRSG
ncbi:MAG TPA: 5-oxoprolinase subunit PxpB [Thermoanaerobaculia bacterium]|jgi:KipI family sensor histidine kinase inhibitor